MKFGSSQNTTLSLRPTCLTTGAQTEIPRLGQVNPIFPKLARGRSLLQQDVKLHIRETLRFHGCYLIMPDPAQASPDKTDLGPPAQALSD